MKGVFLLVKYYWENALIIGILFTGEKLYRLWRAVAEETVAHFRGRVKNGKDCGNDCKGYKGSYHK